MATTMFTMKEKRGRETRHCTRVGSERKRERVSLRESERERKKRGWNETARRLAAHSRSLYTFLPPLSRSPFSPLFASSLLSSLSLTHFCIEDSIESSVQYNSSSSFQSQALLEKIMSFRLQLMPRIHRNEVRSSKFGHPSCQ